MALGSAGDHVKIREERPDLEHFRERLGAPLTVAVELVSTHAPSLRHAVSVPEHGMAVCGGVCVVKTLTRAFGRCRRNRGRMHDRIRGLQEGNRRNTEKRQRPGSIWPGHDSALVRIGDRKYQARAESCLYPGSGLSNPKDHRTRNRKGFQSGSQSTRSAAQRDRRGAQAAQRRRKRDQPKAPWRRVSDRRLPVAKSRGWKAAEPGRVIQKTRVGLIVSTRSGGSFPRRRDRT